MTTPTRLMKVNPKRVRYIPLQKDWRKLKPIYQSEEATRIWQPDMLKYDAQRARREGFNSNDNNWDGWELPKDYDSCEWRWTTGRRGPHPAFWDYVCHNACHHLVNLNLFVATLAFPIMDWRILTSDKHSTVWNNSMRYPLLFDANYLALEVPAEDAWINVREGEVLKSGEKLLDF